MVGPLGAGLPGYVLIVIVLHGWRGSHGERSRKVKYLGSIGDVMPEFDSAKRSVSIDDWIGIVNQN